jgi:epoxyqueuosine reductase
MGFDLAGVTTLGPPDSAGEFDTWLASGYAGEMHYLERGADLRRDSRRPEPGMRSAIVVAMNYGGRQPAGPIARYARGDDYHRVMHEKLDELGRWFVEASGGAARTRSYVDTGPILERDLARRAGLGWFGKNTNLINPALGSFFFIGALFTDADLEPDAPFEADRCGTCTRCLDACPTQAFTAPRSLDATRCISYLTIELKGAIPHEFRAAIGELLYGCDICQDVCPWNVRFSRDVTEPALLPRTDLVDPDAEELLALSEAEWRVRFSGSAMTRTKRRGLARNAAVALGNRRDPGTIPALQAAAMHDPEPLVREHAAWALAQFE